MVRKYLLIIFCLIGAAGCGGCGHEATTAAASSKVILTGSDGLENSVSVELADSNEERALGLMYRESLAPDAGMLFAYTSDATESFWMKNTLISLDIIFIASDLKIVSIARETTPLSLDPIAASAPYRYVLEVRAGYAAAHQIESGQSVRLEL